MKLFPVVFWVIVFGLFINVEKAFALDLPSYLETSVVGGTSTDYGNTIEKDSQGNLFIAGNFGTGTIDFNPGAGVDTFTNAGAADMFLTKFNADGTYAWTKVWGGTGSESIYNIAFDSSDNIYLAAEFGATVDLDPNAGVDSYTSAGSVDIALIKLNTDGTYAYSKVMGSTSHDRLHSVQYSTVDGFIYIAGKFTGTVDFDPSGSTDSKVSAGNYDAYLTKFNTDGTYVWTKTWGGTDRDTVNDMALDSSGNFYLAGVFRNTVNFDATGGTDNKTSAGLDDAFLTRYNADGTYGWTKTWGSTTNDFSFNIRVSPSNDIYIVGSYQLTVDFDPSGVTNNITSAGSEDSYVSKFESDGTYDFTYTWGGALMDEVNTITFDSDGRWYIGGFFNGTIDFDPTGGTDNIASNGLYDQFFSVFDSSDAYIVSKTFGSATEVNWFDEILYELYASGNKLYLTGFYNGTTDFDPGAGTDNETSAGGWDIYYSTYSLDTTAPVLVETGPINNTFDTTPNYIFTTTESGTITYGGSCTSGTTSAISGSNTITFSQLNYGTFNNCTITVTDSMSNVSAVLALSSFSVNARGSVSVVFLQQISDQSRKQNTEQGCTSNTPYSPLTGFRCMGVPPVISKTDTIVSTPNIEIQVYKKETKLFPRDLKLGMTGEDIRELQKYLNKNGFIVAKSGIGSIGKENTRFGPATEAAVIKFQKANKLPGTGFFGPKSRGVVEN